MIRRTTQWAYVQAHAYVLDKQEKMWRVVVPTGPRGHRAELVDRDGRRATTPHVEPFDYVDVLEPDDNEALDALSHAFGEIEIIEERKA